MSNKFPDEILPEDMQVFNYLNIVNSRVTPLPEKKYIMISTPSTANFIRLPIDLSEKLAEERKKRNHDVL